jgi:uncharacterized RDD family membrane protein YckC
MLPGRRYSLCTRMPSADYSVLTPERVSLEYGIAGIGSRAGAALIDTLIQAVAIVVLLAAGFGIGAAVSLTAGQFPATLLVVFLALGTFIVTSGYFILFEIIWNGQTPGKRTLGLRVIRESGYPMRPVDGVIRNLVRIADWLPFFYGIGALVMLFNKRSKRLGDFAGGTIVVREGARNALSSIAAEQMPAAAPEPISVALSSADATLVRDFLVRRDSLAPTARIELARRLASALAQRYQLTLDAEPEAFLERLT